MLADVGGFDGMLQGLNDYELLNVPRDISLFLTKEQNRRSLLIAIFINRLLVRARKS